MTAVAALDQDPPPPGDQDAEAPPPQPPAEVLAEAPPPAPVAAPDPAEVLAAAGAAATGGARRHLLTAAAHARAGEGDPSGGVLQLLALARELMSAKLVADGVQTFRAARQMAIDGQPPGLLDRAVAAADVKLTNEARVFDAALAARAGPNPKVKIAILADSLALPRVDDPRWVPEEPSTRRLDQPVSAAAREAIAETYAGRILDTLEARYGAGSVQLRSHCRRFLTSPLAEAWLHAERTTLKDHLILIHVGLNDCASRIFSERERHAVSLLSTEAQEAIVKFGQVYRTQIIHDDPEHTYVSLDEYRLRLEQCIKIARSFGAKQVFLTTPIQPPLKFELRTPHMRWNFGRYGLAAADITKRFSTRLVDVDRLCWGHGTATTLKRDGMHLESEGHRVIAENFLEQAKPYLPAAA